MGVHKSVFKVGFYRAVNRFSYECEVVRCTQKYARRDVDVGRVSLDKCDESENVPCVASHNQDCREDKGSS